MSEKHRVAITGMGLVLPQGVGLAAAEEVFAGASAVRYLPELAGVPGATGAACLGFAPPAGTEDLDRAVQFAVAAAAEAWDDAGLAGPLHAHPCVSRSRTADRPRSAGRERGLSERCVRRPTAHDSTTARDSATARDSGTAHDSVTAHDSGTAHDFAAAYDSASAHGGAPAPDRVATVLSLSKGPVFALARRTAGWADAAGLVDVTPDAAARTVAARLGLAGPITAPVTACASGGHALVLGAGLIRRGVVDVAIVGAAEASLHPMIVGSYRRLGLLADAGDDPATSVRPFSASRRGFAVGEGAGVLVLESLASARRRGAEPIALVRGWAGGCQAARLIDTEPTGETLSHLLRLALARAGTPPQNVDYVHAHGTATVSNDAAEARAIRAAFGEAAARVSVSSTKGSHGHLLGAATAVELVLTVLAMRRGTVPPTANLTDPDPQIGLDCTPLTARRRPIRTALKIASGFGGQMLAVVLAEPDGRPA